jgi:hypothetical protein
MQNNNIFNGRCFALDVPHLSFAGKQKLQRSIISRGGVSSFVVNDQVGRTSS